MFEPQRHRGTEKTQSPSQTRRHEDTKASQRAPTQPFLNAETRRRRGAERVTQDSTTQRGPGRRRTTTGDRWAGPPLRSQAIIAVVRPSGLRSAERRPRHSSSSFNGWEGRASFPDRREARRNRRAPSASAGEAVGRDKRSRLERTNAPPAGGDHQIADVPAVNPRHRRITSATNPSCLRVFVFAMCDDSVSGLCVSVSLWFFRCFGDPPPPVNGKFEIRNSKFEI